MSKRFLAIFAASVLMLASIAAYAQPADPPGNSGNAPGQQENTPGQQEDGPGNSENAPGQQEDGPGNSENAPGQQDDGPGNSENAPGQHDDGATEEEGDGPGNSDAAHACQKDGYLELAPAESPDEPFENTGDCVSYAAQGGELVEAEGDVEGTPDTEIDDDLAASPEADDTAGTPVSDGPGNSDAAQACQQDGYLELAPAESPDEPFENTGDCVSYAAQGGELVELEGSPATPDASPEASPEA